MKHGLLDGPSLQQMLYETMDHSDDLVAVVEQTGEAADDIVIASANDAFCRACGYRIAELVGRPLRSLAAPGGDPAQFVELVNAVHERRSFRSEALCSRKAGAPFWLGLHLMPVRNTEPPCCIILGRDITESLQMRRQQAAIQGLLARVFQCVKAPVAIVAEAGQIQRWTNCSAIRPVHWSAKPRWT